MHTLSSGEWDESFWVISSVSLADCGELGPPLVAEALPLSYGGDGLKSCTLRRLCKQTVNIGNLLV